VIDFCPPLLRIQKHKEREGQVVLEYMEKEGQRIIKYLDEESEIHGEGIVKKNNLIISFSTFPSTLK